MSKNNVIPRSHIELCIFCAKNKAVSHEHILSHWIHKYLKSIGAKTHKFSLFTRTNAYGGLLQANEIQADDATIPIMCSKCNRSWGSNIQTDASNVLKPFIAGDWVELSTKQIMQIVAWFTSYDMVREMVHDDMSTYTQEERSSFRFNKVIPETLSIWMAPVDLSDYPNSNVRPMVDLFREDGIHSVDTHITIQEIHKVVFVSFYSKIDGFMGPYSAIYRGILNYMRVKGFILLHSSNKFTPIHFPKEKPPLSYYNNLVDFLEEATKDGFSNKVDWFYGGYCPLENKPKGDKSPRLLPMPKFLPTPIWRAGNSAKWGFGWPILKNML